MRSHGIANFPYPTVSGGAVSLKFAVPGYNPSTPRFEAASKVCGSSTGVEVGALPFAQVQPGTPRLPLEVAQGNVTGSFQTVLPTGAELHRFLIESGFALGVMAIVSIGLGWVVAGRVLRPVRAMTTTARHISEENLNQRLAVQGQPTS